MAEDWTVRVEGVSKKFGQTLNSSMKYGLVDCGKRLVGMNNHPEVLRKSEFWALEDINLEVAKGEAIGIMGVNGSGKTTLLRILNGTFSPDKGRARLRGKIGALIAAGAGFSPLLTGRENIYVNGALLGMKSSEISFKLDEIIDFAQLDGFIDMPVRNYSSGMSVRLGFSVAVMSRPDILLVDEVLAVGDLNFQKKCYEQMHKLKREGASILLVSHAIGAIWAVCDKGLYLHKGKEELFGNLELVCKRYDDHNSRSALTDGNDGSYNAHKSGSGSIKYNKVRILTMEANEVTELEFGQPFILEYDIEVFEEIDNPIFRATIDAVHYKFIVSIDSYEQGFEVQKVQPGRYRLRIRCDQQSFRPGAYKVNVAATRRGLGTHLFFWMNATSFVVLNPKEKFLYSEPNAIWYVDAPHYFT